jgi:hypothetical protein
MMQKRERKVGEEKEERKRRDKEGWQRNIY